MAGLPDAAIVTLTNAMKLRSEDGELYKDRARAYLLQKKWSEAGTDLDSAIQLSAGNAEAFRLRGHVLLKLNRLGEAWKDVETAMRLAPKDVDVLIDALSHKLFPTP